MKKRTDIVLHLAGIAHDVSSKYTYKDYIKSNFLKKLYKKFRDSNASIFILLAQVKYMAREEFSMKKAKLIHRHFMKSKLKAENYLLNKINSGSKNILILRTSLIYSNFETMKGNLNY